MTADFGVGAVYVGLLLVTVFVIFVVVVSVARLIIVMVVVVASQKKGGEGKREKDRHFSENVAHYPTFRVFSDE